MMYFISNDIASAFGPPVVLVHGGFCDHRDWRYQFAALAQRSKVYAVDLPGHGRTPIADSGRISPALAARALNEFLAQQAIGPAILVGHSFSTRVVMEAARLNPGGVAGVVLTDTSRVGAPGAPVETGAIMTALQSAGATKFLEGYFRAMMIGRYSSAIFPEVVQRLGGVTEAMISDLLSSTVRWDGDLLDEALERLSGKPVLAIQATTNHLGGERVCAQSDDIPWIHLLRERLGDLDVAIIPDSGHFCMLEKPETVTDHIDAFIDKVGQKAAV